MSQESISTTRLQPRQRFAPLKRRSGRLKVRLGKNINLELLIYRGWNKRAPPKGNLKPFGGFTWPSFDNPTFSFYSSEGKRLDWWVYLGTGRTITLKILLTSKSVKWKIIFANTVRNCRSISAPFRYFSIEMLYGRAEFEKQEFSQEWGMGS